MFISTTTLCQASDTGCPGISQVIEIDGPSYIIEGAVIGDTLIVMDSRLGLTTWDISDPDHASFLGSWAVPGSDFRYLLEHRIEVDPRGYVFCRGRGSIWAFDVRTPDDPQPLWRSDELPGFPSSWLGFDVDGAIMAVSGVGISIIDISDVGSPVVLNSFLEFAVELSLIGSSMVITSPYGPVSVFDISDPSDPEEIATWDTLDIDGNVRHSSGGNLVLITSDYRSALVDLQSPASPQFVDLGYDLHWPYPYDVEFRGQTAYALTDGGSGWDIRAVDFSDLNEPVLIDVAPGRGVLAAGPDRLYQLSTSGITAHRWEQGLPRSGSTEPFGVAEKLVVSGDLGVLADGLGGVVTLDMADLGNIQFLGRVLVDGYAEEIEVSGTTAFVAANNAGLQIIDFSDPADPRRLAGVVFPNAYDIAMTGDLILVAANPSGYLEHDWLEVFDVTDPSQPAHIASVGGYQRSYSVSVAALGTTAVLGSGSHLLLIDLNDPSQPEILSSLRVARWNDGNVYDLATFNDHILAACGSDGLVMVDISDPAAPFEVTRLYLGGATATTVSTTGSTAFVTASWMLNVVDFSDTADPVTRSLPLRRSAWATTPVNDSLVVASPPFLEVISLDCEAPQASFEWQSSGLLVWLSNTTSWWWDEISWDFGDGVVVEDVRDPMHHYAGAGSYELSLTVSGELGSSTTTQTISVVGAERGVHLVSEEEGR